MLDFTQLQNLDFVRQQGCYVSLRRKQHFEFFVNKQEQQAVHYCNYFFGKIKNKNEGRMSKLGPVRLSKSAGTRHVEIIREFLNETLARSVKVKKLISQ